MKALIIVDMQNDFIELNGALRVKGGQRVVPNIVKEAYSDYDLVVATRDFHPQTHISFTGNGGEWPTHCVAGTEGAQLLPEIDMVADLIVSKGTDSKKEAYSGFDGTVLEDALQGITDVVVVGVATDFCVINTAMDAKKLGYKTTVLLDCIAGVRQDTSDDALIVMSEEGIELRSRA